MILERTTVRGAYHVALGAAVALALASSSACVTTSAKRSRSELLQRAEQSGQTAAEAFARADALADDIAGTIEMASDAIIARTSNSLVRRAALRWKAEAVPTTYQALFQSDPIIGLFDGWALVIQMRDYFTAGAGRDEFGTQQQIALDALDRLFDRVRSTAARLVADEGKLQQIERTFNEWATRHPIDAFVTRESIAPEAAALFPELRRGPIASVGDLNQTVTVLSTRLSVYGEYIPKAARWQALLFGEEILARDEVRALSSDIATMASSAAQVGELAETAPDLVTQVTDRMRDELRGERVSLTDTFKRERAMLEAAIARERVALLQGAGEERVATLEALRGERIAALEAAEASAHAVADRTMDRLDATVGRLSRLVMMVVVGTAIWTWFLTWWHARRVAGRRSG